MGRACTGRAPRRERRDGSRRGEASCMAGAAWRGTRSAGDLPCGAGRLPAWLATAHAGHPARRREAERRSMSALALPTAPALRIELLATGCRPWALLIGLCACLFVPGIAAMPPLDRDEARFMQATRQMVESGDLLQIRFQDEARNKKPAGIYWLQSASVALFSAPASTEAWPYRLPSLLGATLSVLLTFVFGAQLVGRPAALLGAALLASSLLLVVEAHLAKTDAALLATVVAAQGALGVLYRGAREGAVSHRGVAATFWLAQGAGILIKGPVTPLVSLLTILALCVADRRRRRPRRWRAPCGACPAPPPAPPPLHPPPTPAPRGP